MKTLPIVAATALAMTVGAMAAHADDESNAVNGCIKQVRKVGGPDAAAGVKVLHSEFSQAGTSVTLRDAGGTVWQCIGYSDGTVGDLKVTDAKDDGGGAMAGASGEPTTVTEQVHFAPGSTGQKLTGTLTPGSSVRYVLGASKGQFLHVNVGPKGKGLSYQIFNPDNSFLLDMIGAAKQYRGQLWQSGDHVIEVINRGKATQQYKVNVTIE